MSPAAMDDSHVEAVSFGHDLAGTIRQTGKAFEVFDADDNHLFDEVTLPAARRRLYERHVGKSERQAG